MKERWALREDRELGELTTVEHLLLMSVLLEEQMQGLGSTALDYAVAGASIMELERQGILDSDIENVILISRAPVADPVLARVQGEIWRGGTKQIRKWLDVIASMGVELRELAMDKLVRQGLLERSERRTFFLFRKVVYSLLDDREAQRMRERLEVVVKSIDIPTADEVRLVCLADATGLLGLVIGREEKLKHTERISVLRKMDLVGQVTAAAIEGVDFSISFGVRERR